MSARDPQHDSAPTVEQQLAAARANQQLRWAFGAVAAASLIYVGVALWWA